MIYKEDTHNYNNSNNSSARSSRSKSPTSTSISTSSGLLSSYQSRNLASMTPSQAHSTPVHNDLPLREISLCMWTSTNLTCTFGTTSGLNLHVCPFMNHLIQNNGFGQCLHQQHQHQEWQLPQLFTSAVNADFCINIADHNCSIMMHHRAYLPLFALSSLLSNGSTTQHQYYHLCHHHLGD